ncbi:hypothetical protein LCM10_16080 [Rossellomorea aquimaris]|uniref:hypothetical protein n=1 Tax=Rossellomorea aquimaris TaxID=189382 RepID=UPI001CD1FE42|nr:hypothetical protein [Rossellomorea aquimaris]MCA1056520.1 hypothetical protein [Rossellomorea aquimaris]
MVGNVIFIEGIPGAGKTSTVNMIAEFLRGKGVGVRAIVEGELDQPADYEGVAFLTDDEWMSIQKNHCKEAERMNNDRKPMLHGWLVHYSKMARTGDWPEKLIHELSIHDIYNKEPELYAALIKHKWQDLNEMLHGTDEVILLDCSLLQNPTTFLSAKHDIGEDGINAFVLDLIHAIRAHRRLVIYLEPREIRASFQHVMAERPDDWYHFVKDYYTTGAYGVNHQLSNDLEGVLTYLEQRVKLEKSILEVAEIEWLHIERNQSDWDDVNKKITDWLSLKMEGWRALQTPGGGRNHQ